MDLLSPLFDLFFLPLFFPLAGIFSATVLSTDGRFNVTRERWNDSGVRLFVAMVVGRFKVGGKGFKGGV